MTTHELRTSLSTNVRSYRHLAGVAVRASPALCAVCVLAVLVSAAAPLAAVAALGAVVGEVPDVAANGLDSPAGRAALWWAGAAGAFFLLQWASGALQMAAVTTLGERIDAALARELMDAVLTPAGVAHLEDPTALDLISVGRETFRSPWSRPGRLVRTVSGVVAGRLMLAGACVMLVPFHPALGAALFVGGIWAAYEDKRASRVEAEHHHGGTELARRTTYYYELGVRPPAAKEVRVFGLSGFLLDRFSTLWRRSMVEVFAPAGHRPLVAALVLLAVVLLGLAWIAWEAVAGRIAPAPAAVYVQALMVSLAGIHTSSWASLQNELALATLRRYGGAVAAVAEAGHSAATPQATPETTRPATPPGSDVAPVDRLPVDTRAVDRRPIEEIRFEGVAFSYPGSTVEVLSGLDLLIPAGRSLAIVGANGVGKSTLIKLLCRSYEPTAGRITVDGTDLRKLDAAEWRRRLAPVFQDSTRFEVPAYANVGFGRADAAGDRAGIEAAAADAGIAGPIDALPLGWDTPLSTAYAGGADLSGGEWQKVGLARALFAVRHGASVLVLDEPAAHLDARAEAELYERFMAITEGLTTIVISHRFSTVRRADSIVVLGGGRVVEQGTHDDLLDRRGAYAEMFTLQASRFGEAAVSEQ
ncbi:ABC transporter ATP-binding protein [Actinopolymorpha sp. B17G11]|uniref:ABC transporter ATP-binding protein n=1 Tax=Actinopolymorpha sp. B17G11 TaxID=3160861 RepID=UPI0032E37F2A